MQYLPKLVVSVLTVICNREFAPRVERRELRSKQVYDVCRVLWQLIIKDLHSVCGTSHRYDN